MIHRIGMKGQMIAISSCLSFASLASIDHPHKEGEVIIKLKSSSPKALDFKSFGVLEQEYLSTQSNAVLLKFSDKSISVEQRVKQLNSNPLVEWAEPNYIYSIEDPKHEKLIFRRNNQHHSMTPNDPLFDQLWGLDNTGTNEPGGTLQGKVGADISAYKAWALTKGSRQIKIAVIDTGIDYNHSDIKENIWVNIAEKLGTPGVDDDGNGYIDDIHGYDFANDDGDPLDGHGHGTHCAGTIGAIHDNTYGIAGVMGNVEIVAIKFLTDSGSGDSANAIKAIDYATTLNVDIMSNSWGGGAFSQLLKEAIERASQKGIIFTAAAGNSAGNNDSLPHYPANYEVDNVISVAAHTANDELASFSCYGKESVDIAAPGQSILSTYAGGGYKILSGTSMATPHVSGALGLILSEEGRMSHQAMRERLLETSVPVVTYRGRVQRGGRLNAFNLLTDYRPERIEPEDDQWQTYDLDEAWESDHPYGENLIINKSFKVTGAKFIRLVLDRVDLENHYDYLQLSDESGNKVSQITGLIEDSYSDYVQGEEMNILFRSDRSITKWGFSIKQIQWQ